MSNNTSSETIMKSLTQKMSRKWLLLSLFLVISIFFLWLLVINIKTMVKDYREYKANIAANAAAKQISENDPRNAVHDNERYNNPKRAGVSKLIGDNASIQTTIDTIKSKYKPVNDLLRKQTNGKDDIIDEQILSSEYDNY